MTHYVYGAYSTGPYISVDGCITKHFASLNFTLDQGDRVIVFGRSGGGKSTIIKILSGLLKPRKGNVTIGGKEVMDLKDIRDKICFIPQLQEISIVVEKGDTLHDTIKIASNFAVQSKVTEAAQLAYLHDEIKDLKYANETNNVPLQNLSGGQKQRVAIARAFLRMITNHKAPLYLMDEATSALDPESKTNVLKNLNTFLSSQTPPPTLLIVSHEPEVIHQHIKFNKAIVFTKTGAYLYTNQDGIRQDIIAVYSKFTKEKMEKNEDIAQLAEMDTERNLQIRVQELLSDSKENKSNA